MTLCTGGCSSLRSLHALRRPVIVHMHARAWCPTGRMCLDDQLLPFCGRVMRVDAGLLYRAELLEYRDCRLQRWTNLIRFQNRYNIDTILSKYRDINTIIYYSQTIFRQKAQLFGKTIFQSIDVVVGGAENARLKNARLEKAAPNCTVGKRGNAKRWTKLQGWKSESGKRGPKIAIVVPLPQPYCENSRSHVNDMATAARTTPQTSDSGRLLCFTVTYLVIQRASWPQIWQSSANW